MPSSTIKSISQKLINKLRSKTTKRKSVKSSKSKYNKLSSNTNKLNSSNISNSNKSNNINENIKNLCGSFKRNKGKSGISGDFRYCNQGSGPCRKLKTGQQYPYVKCKQRSKKLLRNKKLCPKSYLDCKHYGSNKSRLPYHRMIPKTHIRVRSTKWEPSQIIKIY